jgi:hypothetical protein
MWGIMPPHTAKYVYDNTLSGCHLRRFVVEHTHSGTHSLSWFVETYLNGRYFYPMELVSEVLQDVASKDKGGAWPASLGREGWAIRTVASGTTTRDLEEL